MIKTLFTLALSCPNISPMTNFNTTEYIRKTWYIQQQQITGYQPENSLYCVAQTLDQTNHTVPFYNGNVLAVYNYGNLNSVNGPQENRKNITLCARQVNESDPARLINAPCFLPNQLAGPYWVIAAGPNSSDYQWAIISGGPPNIKYPDGNCSTSLKGTNGSGLWLITRNMTTNSYYINTMREVLNNIGYTTSKLLNVTQMGCNYTNAYIK